MEQILPIPQHTPYINAADNVVDLQSLIQFMVIAFDQHPFVVVALSICGCALVYCMYIVGSKYVASYLISKCSNEGGD